MAPARWSGRSEAAHSSHAIVTLVLRLLRFYYEPATPATCLEAEIELGVVDGIAPEGP
ncbi:MAG: hypothetical protein JWN46_3754 [Acidimicrobiales bacterium]|nr:hypothetical protein [Acidimicrobiales bacterium]